MGKSTKLQVGVVHAFGLVSRVQDEAFVAERHLADSDSEDATCGVIVQA